MKTNPIILALDGMQETFEQYESAGLLKKFAALGVGFKVNDYLFHRGMGLISMLSGYGPVMADMKLHDTPQTVANVCRKLAAYRPWAVTVHASGGVEMIQAAVDALDGSDTKVLAVTVLTSLGEGACFDIYDNRPGIVVEALSDLAVEGGAHGLVCSAQEVEEMRGERAALTLVVPGVRSPGADAGGQKRVGTPRQAIDDGADRIVMGRQILQAPDPVEELKRVMRDELAMDV